MVVAGRRGGDREAARHDDGDGWWRENVETGEDETLSRCPGQVAFIAAWSCNVLLPPPLLVLLGARTRQLLSYLVRILASSRASSPSHSVNNASTSDSLRRLCLDKSATICSRISRTVSAGGGSPFGWLWSCLCCSFSFSDSLL